MPVSMGNGQPTSCSTHLPPKGGRLASAGTAKNGSDSGSNSPDENGQGEPPLAYASAAWQRSLGKA